ncbi:hypothetical protein MKQ68_11445 [Chitinophaga horti]|uniref:Uncharacterized protein n=1 Tax=Chitinophaga horti TaxID=2920382 RepID=A0ABY6J8R6_9BACT|nr:hypothetical protein [Chitinophaga horti]UYQ95716.1 hypothetical protein MKQ68_11445 [Chitinophaga horti]
MKRIISAMSLSLFLLPAWAQPTNERGWYQSKDIGNVDIGWINVVQFKEPAKPFSKDGWNYTAKQLEFGRNMVQWTQQTYVPKGMLGEMKLSVYAQDASAPINSSSYNYNEAEKNNRNALPNTYGCYAKMYMHLQKTATKKFWPIDGMADTYGWNIMANSIEHITYQVVALSSPDEFWFTQPKYEIGMKGEWDKEWLTAYANYRNFTNSPNLKKYEHYLIPSNAVDYTKQTYYAIVMTKDGKPLPFEQVTVGEMIVRLEKQLPMMHKIAINNGTRLDNLMGRAEQGLRVIKEQFSNRKNEYVYFHDPSPQIDIVDLANIERGKEVNWIYTQATVTSKQGATATHFPLLRLKKGVKEALTAAGPQWIVFRLARGINPDDAGEVHMMETFVNRFNYDYVYDYYFGKDKMVTPYKPLNFASADESKSAAAPSAASETAKKMAADKSVLFYEDFSTVATGASPAKWYTERSSTTGDKVVVTEVNGASGKWLKLKKTAYPTTFTGPAGGDFTISFDVLVQKGDVAWGTPGMRFEFSDAPDTGNKNFFNIDVSPGDMNRKDAAGWVMVSRNMPDGYETCPIESYYSLPSFTGSKLVNQVNMAIRKKGETITVLCNDQKVFECPKGMPAGLGLKAIRFVVNEKNVYYVSNILVTK